MSIDAKKINEGIIQIGSNLTEKSKEYDEKLSDANNQIQELLSLIGQIKEVNRDLKSDKEELQTEIGNTTRFYNNLKDKFFQILRNLFPEENFSENDFSGENFQKILEKISQLNKNFLEGGEKILEEKDKEIEDLKKLVDKFKHQRNFLAKNKKGFESEKNILFGEIKELTEKLNILKDENIILQENIKKYDGSSISFNDIVLDLENKLLIKILN